MHRLITAFVALIIAAVFVTIPYLIVSRIIYEHDHPCVRSEEYDTTCGGGMYCVVYDNHMNCRAWSHHPTYPCKATRCLERGDRKAMEADAEVQKEFNKLKDEL